MIYETDPQFLVYVFVEDTFKCMIDISSHTKAMIILAGILSIKFMFKNCQKTNTLPILALVCGVYYECVTFLLVSWVRCGT